MKKIETLKDLKKFAHEAHDALGEDSAFEKLLKVLVEYGMNEDKAAQMIADCIDEQYKLDEIAEKFSEIYHNAKETIINDGREYKA